MALMVGPQPGLERPLHLNRSLADGASPVPPTRAHSPAFTAARG